MQTNKYENIKDKKVSVPLRIRMGGALKFLDRLFGGDRFPGLIVGGAYFVTGDPNAGKTTITLQMADQLTAMGHRVLYNNTEMIESEIKMMQERLELKYGFGLHACDTNKDSFELESFMRSVLDKKKKKKGGDEITPSAQLAIDFAHECKLIEKDEQDAYDPEMVKAYEEQRKMFPQLPALPEKTKKRVVLFIDSVQSLAENSNCNPKEIVYMFDQMAKMLNATVIFIGQATKNGSFAGSNKLPHKVTTHVHFTVIENDGNNQVRKATTKKNRAGPCGSVYTRLTQVGHIETDYQPEEK